MYVLSAIICVRYVCYNTCTLCYRPDPGGGRPIPILAESQRHAARRRGASLAQDGKTQGKEGKVRNLSCIEVFDGRMMWICTFIDVPQVDITVCGVT